MPLLGVTIADRRTYRIWGQIGAHPSTSHRKATMISRRNLIAAGILGAPLFIGPPVFAAEKMDYTPAAFDAAQKAGKSILVEIHATWCPTCKAQAPILSELENDRKFNNLLVIHVDFD